MRTLPSTLSTIFFDLGGTLIHTCNPWEPIYARANRELVSALREAGLHVGEEPLAQGCSTFFDYYYSDRGSGIVEKTAVAALQEILTARGIDPVPPSTLQHALDRLFAVTQQNWALEEDAIPLLEWLRGHGIHLGAITNGSDENNLYTLLDRFALRDYFEVIVSSSACRIRKPDERIFHLALDGMEVQPSQAAMVGDTLSADILGANRMGMPAIWITRRAEEMEFEGARPDFVINALSEIPALLGG